MKIEDKINNYLNEEKEIIHKVGYQTRSDKYMDNSHGLTFINGKVETYPNEIQPSRPYPKLSGYIEHLVDKQLGVLRVWLDNKVIWDWEHDWHVNSEELYKKLDKETNEL